MPALNAPIPKITPDSIPVVCAIIERDGLVLLAQRPHHKHLGGKWEFPGGKVDPGETPAQALIREIREELSCFITLGHELPHNEHTYDQTIIEMIPYLARLPGDITGIKPTEHIALAWVKPEELLDYDLAPADFPVVTAYQQYHESTPETSLNADRHMLRRQLIDQGRAAFAASQKHFQDDPAGAALQVRKQFAGYFGDLQEQLKGPLHARQVGGGKGPGFRYENLLFESHPGWDVSATLYLPATGTGPWPAVVVPVGHSGKQFPNYQFPCQYFARAGLAALVFDPPGVAGEKQTGNDHFADGVRCYLTGDTSGRYFVGDALCAMDYLATRSDVDTSHGFACTGVSGGGHTSVFAALLDDRVTAIAPSCCMGPQFEHVLERSYSNCPETLMIGRLRDGIDDCDLLSALTPRPLLVMAGSGDEIYRMEDSRALAKTVRQFYTQSGSPQQFTFFADESGHAYSLKQASIFTAWLRQSWQLTDQPLLPSVAQEDYQLLAIEALQCHPNPAVNMRSLTQQRAKDFSNRRIAPDPEQLLRLIGMRDDTPTPFVESGASSRTWFHDWTESRIKTDPGIVVPLTQVSLAEDVPLLWHFNPDGRSKLMERGGMLMDAIGHLDRTGRKASLLAADLRGWGETTPAFAPFENVSWGGSDRFAAYVSASLGDAVEAGRIRDAWHLYHALPPHNRTVLHAVGAAGPVALHLAALTRSFNAVILYDAPGSYEDMLSTEDFNWPHDIVLPGVLQYYDLPLLAAAAGCPVHWLNPLDGAGQPLSAEECGRRSHDNLHWHDNVKPADHLAMLREMLYA